MMIVLANYRLNWQHQCYCWLALQAAGSIIRLLRLLGYSAYCTASVQAAALTNDQHQFGHGHGIRFDNIILNKY